jgi:hypothetical protein
MIGLDRTAIPDQRIAIREKARVPSNCGELDDMTEDACETPDKSE